MTTTDTHDQALNWFVRLSDADAPEAAWLEFEAWLEVDPDHRRAYDLIEQVWVALDEPASAEVIVAPIAANDAGPAPGTAWRPDLNDQVKAAKTQTAKLAVLRDAGCKCDDPVKAHARKSPVNEACPAHGIPF